jgi:PD-(D/E)XK nuclease superfamily
VLGSFVVSDLNANRTPMLAATLQHARHLFDIQKDFAMHHRLRDPGMSVSKAGPAFAAFSKVEYGERIVDEEFDVAWKDVETALRNVWKLDDLRARLRRGRYRIAQRNLLFELCGGKVRAVPDLIVFFPDLPPLIVDWKVHSFGVRDYGDQLATYALALARTNPHSDFPRASHCYQAHEIELMEVQLLLGSVRTHILLEQDIYAVQERIAEGIVAFELAYDGKSSSELRPEEFPTAENPQTCQTCSYRKLCWNQTP